MSAAASRTARPERAGGGTLDLLSLDDQPGSRGFMNVLSWCGGDGGLKYRGVWWQLGCRARGACRSLTFKPVNAHDACPRKRHESKRLPAADPGSRGVPRIPWSVHHAPPPWAHTSQLPRLLGGRCRVGRSA
eukprot:scaffold20761_cov70-Phaeocystis_antarctica.AAC.5